MIRKSIVAVAWAAALALFCVATTSAFTPANAAVNAPVGFNVFHDRLAAHGTWVHNDRWGDVWRPGGVSADFRPYFDRGHWVYTADDGWFWASDDEWGDVVYHYGRWVFDPDEGWIWIPGYIWGPGWVVWRWGGGFAGWMPAPPDFAFITGVGINFTFGLWGTNFYGYRGWYGGRVGPENLWVFVGGGHIGDRDYRPFLVDRSRVTEMIRSTRDVTQYAVVHGVVVNHSFGAREVARLSGHAIVPVSARTVMHGTVPITKVDEGRWIALGERTHHPFPAGAFSRSSGKASTNTATHSSTVTHKYVAATYMHRAPATAHHRRATHHTITVHHGMTYHLNTHHIGAPQHVTPARAVQHAGSSSTQGSSGHSTKGQSKSVGPH